MKLLDEFKAFAMRGNVVDMAVGIIIGAAFGKVVSSFVNNVVMPPLGVLIGGVNFTDLAIVLKQAEGDAAEVAIGYGMFIQSVVTRNVIKRSQKQRSCCDLPRQLIIGANRRLIAQAN